MMVRNTGFTQDWQLGKSNVRERFKEVLQLSEFTDCSFSVGSSSPEVIRCHKLVLAVTSPVFQAMFYGELSNTHYDIKITDIEPSSFKQFLRYIYSDTLELKNIDEAGSLLYIGKKYLVPHLSKKCLEYLMDHTYLQHLWDVIQLAESLNEDVLLEHCIKVMTNYHPSVWLSGEEHISLNLLQRFLSQNVMAMSELEIWLFVEKWLKKECTLREMEVTIKNERAILKESGLLGSIRLGVLTKEELDSKVRSSGLLTEQEIESRICSLFVVPRFKPTPINYVSSREIIRHIGLIFLNGPVKTKISSTGLILVKGFSIINHRNCYVPYSSQSCVTISDQSGIILTETDYSVKDCDYNSEQRIMLSKPVWFQPCIEYTVAFEAHGMYQACSLLDTSMAKASLSMFFKFVDPDLRVELSNEVTKLSYIVSVLFSL